MKLFAGASGYSFKEWKGSFYPADMKPEGMLAFYSARLPTVQLKLMPCPSALTWATGG